jgi:zinc transporter, ZIP family
MGCYYMESLLFSFLAGISTVLGALVVLFFGVPGKNLLSGMLGFAGGVMLGLALFDLMPEALEQGSMASALIGFLLGVAIMYVLDRIVPYAHLSPNQNVALKNASSSQKGDKRILRVGYLIFFGIALHNLPEGLAIGAGMEASPELGLYIAIAIGLHNIPEGIAVAGPLRAGGLPIANVFFLTLIAGLMAPLGAALGLIFFNISPMFIAGGLAFAAGAMVYIVNDELIPQSHKLNSHVAIGGLIFGLLVVFVLTG